MSKWSTSPRLGLLRAVLFAVWGLTPENDPAPRVLIERGRGR